MLSLLLGICVFIMVIFALMGISSTQAERQQVEARVADIVPLEQKKKAIYARASETTSFWERVLFPLSQSLYQRFRQFIPSFNNSWAKEKLISAGLTHPKYLQIYYGSQFLFTVGIGSFSFFYGWLILKGIGLPNIAITCVGALFGYLFPMMVVSNISRKRQSKIQKSLPDFIELLVICVEGGLSLDVAIQKINNCQKTSETNAPLKEELTRYLADIEFGRSRREALEALGERAGVDDLKTFINALVLAYEMGSSVAHTLRIQCDTLRSKRMQRAEEKAQKIPVKMVLPIYIFLFPAIFVSIFGPLGMLIVSNVGTMFSGLK